MDLLIICPVIILVRAHVNLRKDQKEGGSLSQGGKQAYFKKLCIFLRTVKTLSTALPLYSLSKMRTYEAGDINIKFKLCFDSEEVSH